MFLKGLTVSLDSGGNLMAGSGIKSLETTSHAPSRTWRMMRLAG